MPSYFVPSSSKLRSSPRNPQGVPEELQEADLVAEVMALIEEIHKLIAELVALAATSVAEAEEALRSIRSAPIQT
jgi:hypothetical protein